MYFADEIRPQESVENLPTGVSLGEKEVQLAMQLISALSSKFDLTKFKDTHREQVHGLIQKKARGEEIVSEPAPPKAQVIDLMSALKSSLQSARAGVDLASLTRSELLERATRAEISGRSKMSKEELIRALEKKAS
jgi:DNA end-binding protein Ku